MKRLVLVALVACSSKAPPPDAPPPPPEAPLRDATGDADVRILVADLLAGRACDEAVHHFGGMRDKVRKQVITGQVWIRDCRITNDGTNVTAEISGDGWQWIEKSQKKAGGTFDEFWEKARREGGHYEKVTAAAVHLDREIFQTNVTAPGVAAGLTLVAVPHIFFYDGRGAKSKGNAAQRITDVSPQHMLVQ